jgi:U2 small nuclear ribonucleoprotein A'
MLWHLELQEEGRVINVSLQPQDAIDFTDNDIQQLGNFPLSERLKTLLLARNRISTIQPTLANSLPNLTVLVLTSNNLTELADLEPLSKLKMLTHLTLLENPVTRKDVSFILCHCVHWATADKPQHYRHWVIWKCPSVRFLDYQKVKDAERKRAEELFGTEQEPSPLASNVRARNPRFHRFLMLIMWQIMGIKSRTFDLGEATGAAKKEYAVRLTAAEKKKIEEKIKAAKSLEEVARLERELREGPSGDVMEE